MILVHERIAVRKGQQILIGGWKLGVPAMPGQIALQFRADGQKVLPATDVFIARFHMTTLHSLSNAVHPNPPRNRIFWRNSIVSDSAPC